MARKLVFAGVSWCRQQVPRWHSRRAANACASVRTAGVILWYISPQPDWLMMTPAIHGNEAYSPRQPKADVAARHAAVIRYLLPDLVDRT